MLYPKAYYAMLYSKAYYAMLWGGVIINPTIKAHLPYAHTQRSFLISHHCKLDTRMHKSNMHPELQMQHTVAIGLAVQNCQFDSPCDDLAQCSFPAKPNSELVHLNSPPSSNLQNNPKRCLNSRS